VPRATFECVPLRWALGLGTVMLAIAAGPAAAAETIVTTPHAIGQFAQDGSRLAWGFTRCGQVQIHSLRTGRTSTVSSLRCGDSSFPLGIDGLALAGRRALWRTLFDFPCTNFIGKVYTATRTSPQRRIDTHGSCARFATDGDRATLVYSKWDRFVSGGGRTFRVTEAGDRVALQGVPPARKIVATDGWIALVPAGDPGSVEIRDAETGALRSSITPAGNPRVIALRANAAALLVDDADDRRIEWYELDGTPLGDVNVGDNAKSLDMAGRRVVYRTRRTVHLLDTRTEERSIVARPPSPPIGLSIEGRRIAWAMNIAGDGRIKSVTLPAE
jgi:hypothetical protein